MDLRWGIRNNEMNILISTHECGNVPAIDCPEIL